jgi:hypothetical protein
LLCKGATPLRSGIYPPQLSSTTLNRVEKYVFIIETTMNLAFYTCYYGSSNGNSSFRVPALPSTTYHCYYFTNNADIFVQLKSTEWIAVFDDKPVSEDLTISATQAKHIKSCPHKYSELKDYDYLFYFDNKLSLKVGRIEYLIQYCFQQENFALVTTEHQTISCKKKKRDYVSIWDEFKAAMPQPRYSIQRDKILDYIKTQSENGLSLTAKDHYKTGLLLRNMKHEKINKLNETWYSHIEECGIDCQLSMFFVRQLFQEFVYMTPMELIQKWR